MTRSPLDVVVDALETHDRKVKRHGDQVDAQCPAHDDTAPSLSIRYDRSAGKVLVNCHVGCTPDEVVAALGLTWVQLFDEKPKQDHAQQNAVTATYDYCDEDGEVLFQKLRYGPVKTFKAQRPDGRGGWTWGLGDTRRVLYRLPELRAAITAGKPVLLVEGEKDADRVATELGMAATCNFEGAAEEGHRPKWRREYTEVLRGAQVVIVADNDSAGLAHARAEAAALQGVAAQVRVFRPAVDFPKADMTDHLDAGYGIEDLVPVVDEADAPASGPADVGTRQLRVTKASAVKIRRQRWLWDNRIVLGGLTLLAGREGLGKSTIACDVSAQVTRGLLDGEFKGEPRTVIYIHSEDARDTTIVPRLTAANADLDRVIFVDAVQSDEDGEFESQVVLPTDVAELAQLAIDNAAALVVLDAATSVIDSRLDGDKDRQMRKGLEAIARGIGEKAGCAVLGIVHFGKRDSGDTGKLILGSIAWSQVARSVLAVAKDEDSGNLVVSATKSNLAPSDAASLSAQLVNRTIDTEDGLTNVGLVQWLGETSQDARDLLSGPDVEDIRTEHDEAVDWLKDYLTRNGGGAPAGEVLKAAKRDGIAERTLQRARKKAGVSSAKGATSWGWSLQGADDDTQGQGASGGNPSTSEDAKTPDDVHVQASWRLGALAPSEETAIVHSLWKVSGQPAVEGESA